MAKDWKGEIADMLKDPKPIVLEDKSNQKECGMCGLKTKKLYHYRIGSVNKYICGRCKAIMDM